MKREPDGLRIAKDLVLPTSVVGMRMPILAEPNAGKSVFLAVLMEELWRLRLQFVEIDGLGTGWGIKTSADGKKAGIPVPYLGGKGRYADAPLRPDGGAVVARALAKTGVSMVLNVAGFSREDQNRFVADFWNELLRIAGERHEAGEALSILNLVDEAGFFMPEIPRGKEQARAQDAGERVARQGRGLGLGFAAPTQRPQGLDKDVLGVWEVMVLMRLTEPAAIDAAIAQVRHVVGDELAKEIRASLPRLSNGEAWIISPRVLGYTRRVQLRMRDTYDSTRTPAPGERRRAPTSLARGDLSALREALAAVPDEPVPDTSDDKRLPRTVRELRATVRQLEQDLAAEKLRVPVPPPPERVEVPVLTDADRELLASTARRVDGVGAEIRGFAESLAALGARMDTIAKTPAPAPQSPPAITAAAPAARSRPRSVAAAPASTPGTRSRPVRAAARVAPAPASGSGAPLKKGARKMLATLAGMHPVKLTATQLGTMARLSTRGGTFSQYLGLLKREGFVREDDDRLLSIADPGFTALGLRRPARNTTKRAALEALRLALKKGARQMFDVLLAERPKAITRDELAERAKISADGGTFWQYLGTLKRNGVVVEQKRGKEVVVRLNDALFA